MEPGQEFRALWGTGYDTGRAFVEVVHRGKHRVRTWTEPGRTQQILRQTVNEGMRGGFQLLVTMVRENRAYTVQRTIDVPWSNKQLTVKWESHRSKLEPGSKEKWTAVVTGPDAERVVAEVVAGMYDASLDAFLPHAWDRAIGGFYQDSYSTSVQFQNQETSLQWLWGNWARERKASRFERTPIPAGAGASGCRATPHVRKGPGVCGRGRAGTRHGDDASAVPPAAAPAETMAADAFQAGEA